MKVPVDTSTVFGGAIGKRSLERLATEKPISPALADMQKLIVSPKSWHYRFAAIGGFDSVRCYDMNLCRYSWCVFRGLVGVLLLLAGGIALSIGGIDAALAAWFWIEPNWYGITAMMLVLVSVLLCFFKARDALIDRSKSKTSALRLVVAGVQSAAGRYCLPIQVSEDESL